jgi:hypothetical protein
LRKLYPFEVNTSTYRTVTVALVHTPGKSWP